MGNNPVSKQIVVYLESYATNEHRLRQIVNLKSVLGRVNGIVSSIVYGSYLTDKEKPNDIDIVIWLKDSLGYCARVELEDSAREIGIDLRIMKGALFDSYLAWIRGTKKLIE